MARMAPVVGSIAVSAPYGSVLYSSTSFTAFSAAFCSPRSIVV